MIPPGWLRVMIRVSEGVGSKQQHILQQRESEHGRAGNFEDENLQPCIERRLRAIAPLPFLREYELLAFIQAGDG
jgi:hypothetical protein